MATPDPQEVAPWYLRNINQALALNSATGNVYVRTDAQLSLSNVGNVIVSDVSIHDLGNVDISGNTMPVSGNVTVYQGTTPWVVSGNVNANVTQGTDPWVVSGNVNANVTQGTDPWVVSGNVVIDSGNITVTQQPSSLDLFGEQYAIPITPTVQIDSIFGIDTEVIQTYTGGGGNVSAANGIFECSSTSTVGSYAVARSRRFNSFRPGQSMIGRWLTKFGTPASGTSQRIGLNNQEQGFYIGYNGTDFGILQVSGGKTPLYKVTVTSYSGTQTVTLTLNGTAYTVSILTGESINNAAQRIADIDFGGLWLATQQDNTVLLTYAGALGPLGGTFSISSSGNLVGSVTTVQAGVAVTNTWYIDGTPGGFNKPSWLTPTNYVSYAIKYAWAGAYFYAFNPSTQQYEYLWKVGGTSSLPVANPTFKAASLAHNTGGSTAVTTSTAAMFMGLEGIESLSNYISGASSSQSTLAQNVIHHCMTIQNPYVYANKTNTLQATLADLTVSLQVNDPSQIFLYVDQALATGLQDYVSQDGKPVSVSTVTGTFSASAIPIASFIVGNTGSTTQFDLTPYRLQLAPGQTLSIACLSTATINKCAVSLIWSTE